MADAYEALQLHILGAAVNEPAIERGRKERDGLQAVYQARDYEERMRGAFKREVLGGWWDKNPLNPANARSPHGMADPSMGFRSHGTGRMATVEREAAFVALVNRHGTDPEHGERCAWAQCMDATGGCRRIPVPTMAAAEAIGACCPCTCGADARAMADSMKAGEQRRWFPEAFAEAELLGRKKPWQHDQPAPLVGNAQRLGVPPVWDHAEPDAWYDRPTWPRVEPLWQHAEAA